MTKEDKDYYDKNNYAGTTFVGKTGIEKQYEKLLHGLSGEKQIERNVDGRVVGSVTGAIIAVQNGADIVRVHDVLETKDALTILGGVS